MQISKCYICIKFLSKTFKFFSCINFRACIAILNVDFTINNNVSVACHYVAPSPSNVSAMVRNTEFHEQRCLLSDMTIHRLSTCPYTWSRLMIDQDSSISQLLFWLPRVRRLHNMLRFNVQKIYLPICILCEFSLPFYL